MTRGQALAAVVLAAAVVRAVPAVATARLTTDVLRYHKVGTHVLDTSWNPYQAPGLYPYPPLWVWFETGSLALSRATGWSFPVLVKLVPVAADAGIVALLFLWAGRRPAWAYALHPVAVLVTAVHGQFDSLMLLFLLAALAAAERGRAGGSGAALSASIATKSFPVVLLPFLARDFPRRDALRLALVATVPVGLALLPYVLHDPAAVRRELLGYGGVADFGWIGVWRGLVYLTDDRLIRSEAVHWESAVLAAKLFFLAAYLVFLAAWWRRRVDLPLRDALLVVVLGFLVFYGALSAQYLLWPVALGALRPDRWFAAYGVVAAGALVAFYSFFHPSVLYADGVARAPGGAWVMGAAAVLGLGAAWLAALLRRGATRP